MSDVSNEDIFRKMLENFDTDEIYNLCKQVSEKYLDNDNELYKYFHDGLEGESHDQKK